MEIESWKKYVAEAIGTMILTFMGCGAAVVLGAKSPGGHLAVALAFGLSIVACAYVIGTVSGCHINPAVSLGVLLNGGMKVVDFVGYVISQIIGAIAGAGLLKVLVGFGVKDMTGGLGTNGLAGVAGSAGAGLFVEVILTFIFVLAILGVTSKKEFGSVAGIVIGLTLAFVHIVGIPLTGTSVNPARSIGPALFAGGAALSSLWVFIVGPLVGAALAAVVYRFVFKTKEV
jgi:aquaporin Z